MSINKVPDADFTPNLGNYRELTPFRFWCQKVLPLVYDDSLSYYELLCKVVDYLNKTMEDVDILHEDVMGLHEAYVLLQKYVNDYFTNLDVQEEINNKLDEFAKNGTLSNLIKPIVINNLPPIVVDSTSKMTDKSKMYILNSNGHLYQWSDVLNAFSDTGLSYGQIGNVLTTKLGITEGDLNDVATNTVIALGYPPTGAGFVNSPINHPGYLITYSFADGNAKMQIIYDYNRTSVWWRQCTVAGVWSEWLNTTSLKDAGVAGDKDSYPYSDIRDMNSAPINALLSLSSLGEGDKYINTPNNSQGAAYLMTYQWGDSANGRIQFYYDYTGGRCYYRTCKITGQWTAWLNQSLLNDGGLAGGNADEFPYGNVRDMNAAPINAVLSLTSPLPDGEVYYNTPNNAQSAAYVFTYQWGDSPVARIQFYYEFTGGRCYYRTCNTKNEWTAWLNQSSLCDAGIVGVGADEYPYSYVRNMNSAPVNTLLSLSSPLPDGDRYVNTPGDSQGAAYIFTYQWADSPNARLQFYYAYTGGLGYYRTCSVKGEWTEWKVNNNSITYNTTKNVTENTYTNTYNNTFNPTITTDTNAWLSSTGDSKDRSQEIVAMLKARGSCRLGEGIFYIANPIEMPSHTTLEGSGFATILQMSTGVEQAMIIPTDYCTS